MGAGSMARRKQETLTLFPEVLETTRKLTDAQFGALMRAAFAYRFQGEDYAGDDPAVDMAFQFLASQIDRYLDICAVNRQNAASAPNASEVQRNAAECSGMPLQSNPIPSNPIQKVVGPDRPSRSTPKRFVPPTLEEVQNYCRERNISVDPVKFWNYYESVGWKRGRNSIKNWKSCIATWERGDKDTATQPALSRTTYTPPVSSASPYWEVEPC